MPTLAKPKAAELGMATKYIDDGGTFGVPVLLVVAAESLGALFLLQKALRVLPQSDELNRLDVVHEPQVGIDPLGFPLVAPDVLDNLHALVAP